MNRPVWARCGGVLAGVALITGVTESELSINAADSGADQPAQVEAVWLQESDTGPAVSQSGP
jgi:hypothetical protein